MGLRDRATAAVYLVYGLQAVGMAISWQFVTLFVKHELGTPDFLTLTIVWAGPAFVTILAVNFWGAFSDRISARKPFMIVGFIGYAYTFTLYSFVTTSVQFLGVAVLGAILSSASMPAGTAHLTTGTKRKGERMGYFISVQSAGWFIGALTSGIFYDIVGMFTLYRFAAVVCVLATGIAIVLVRDLPIEDEHQAETTSFLTLLKRPGIARITILVAFSQIGINAISFMYAIIIVDELGGLALYVGLSNSIPTLIAVAITGYIGKVVDRRGPVKILILATMSYVLFSIAFALVTNPIAAAIMWSLPIYPLSSTASYAFASMLSGEEERGRAMSLISGAQNIGAAFGPVVGGLFAQFVFGTVQPVSWINMVFNLAALVIAVSLIRVVGSGAVNVRKSDAETDQSEKPFGPLSR
ncbi:MAG: MFS transporter [Candidatus Thorarchaeota archaeon]